MLLVSGSVGPLRLLGNSWAKQNKTPRSALPKLHPKRELHLQNLFFHKLGGDPTTKWMNLLNLPEFFVFFQVGYKHQTYPGICSHFSMMWCVDVGMWIHIWWVFVSMIWSGMLLTELLKRCLNKNLGGGGWQIFGRKHQVKVLISWWKKNGIVSYYYSWFRNLVLKSPAKGWGKIHLK